MISCFGIIIYIYIFPGIFISQNQKGWIHSLPPVNDLHFLYLWNLYFLLYTLLYIFPFVIPRSVIYRLKIRTIFLDMIDISTFEITGFDLALIHFCGESFWEMVDMLLYCVLFCMFEARQFDQFRLCVSWSANTTSADDLVTSVTRSSANMVLTKNILYPLRKGLMIDKPISLFITSRTYASELVTLPWDISMGYVVVTCLNGWVPVWCIQSWSPGGYTLLHRAGYFITKWAEKSWDIMSPNCVSNSFSYYYCFSSW